MPERKTRAIFRIIGNDLPGRPEEISSEEILKFILNNEYQLDDAEKFYFLNRIVDRGKRDLYVKMIQEKGYDVFEERFKYETFAAQESLTDKLAYVAPVNQARNKCLEIGFEMRFQEVFPLNLQTYFTSHEWGIALSNSKSFPDVSHTLLAQATVQQGEENAKLCPADFIENGAPRVYAIGFRPHFFTSYDDTRLFGDCDREELLAILGVAGPWNQLLAKSGYCPGRKITAKDEAKKIGCVRVLAASETDYETRKTIRLQALSELIKQVQLAGAAPIED